MAVFGNETLLIILKLLLRPPLFDLLTLFYAGGLRSIESLMASHYVTARLDELKKCISIMSCWSSRYHLFYTLYFLYFFFCICNL